MFLCVWGFPRKFGSWSSNRSWDIDHPSSIYSTWPRFQPSVLHTWACQYLPSGLKMFGLLSSSCSCVTLLIQTISCKVTSIFVIYGEQFIFILFHLNFFLYITTVLFNHIWHVVFQAHSSLGIGAEWLFNLLSTQDLGKILVTSRHSMVMTEPYWSERESTNILALHPVEQNNRQVAVCRSSASVQQLL